MAACGHEANDLGALACALAAGLGLAAPAAAQQGSVSDPAVDTADHGLDITHARLANRDHAVVATVRFTDFAPDRRRDSAGWVARG